MRKTGILLAMLVMAFSGASGQDAGRKALADKYGPRLEKILEENIIAYWYPGSLDRVNGGYQSRPTPPES